MSKPPTCSVDGCTNSSHARGYCRKHYGQIWRRGMIYTDSDKRRNSGRHGSGSGVRREDLDRLRAMERELHRAKEMYNGVVGVQGRIRWRKEVVALELQIQEIITTNDDIKNAFKVNPEAAEEN